MNEHKLTKAIEGLVGTRTYLPIDANEAIFVFERKRYIHIFHGIQPVFGSTVPHAVARKLISLMDKGSYTYHPILLDKINE